MYGGRKIYKLGDCLLEMEMDTKIEQWKVLAEVYLKQDIKVFIKDYKDTWYFADILIVGEDTILIQCFEPEDKKGLKFDLFWQEISYFDKYKGEIK
jgi:hypothetical protein